MARDAARSDRRRTVREWEWLAHAMNAHPEM